MNPAQANPNAGTRLHMDMIHKRFGSTRALCGVSLTVAPAEVHALVGETGPASPR